MRVVKRKNLSHSAQIGAKDSHSYEISHRLEKYLNHFYDNTIATFILNIKMICICLIFILIIYCNNNWIFVKIKYNEI